MQDKKKKQEFKKDGLEVQQQALKTHKQKTKYIKKMSYI